MSADVNTRASQGAETEIINPSTSPSPSPSAPSTNKDLKPTDSSLPKANSADEAVTVPGVITGSYLVCVSDGKTDAKAKASTVSCALKASGGASNVDLKKTYESCQWGVVATSDVGVSSVELPAASGWQVQYSISSTSDSDIRSLLQKIRFTLNSIDANKVEKKWAVGANVVLQEAPDDEYIRLKSDLNICLDLSHGETANGVEFLTYTCNPEALNQRISFNSNMQLTINGACLTFTEKGAGVVGPCAGTNPAPSWTISGNKIQMWNAPYCLGSGAGIARGVACDPADQGQQWVIGKRVLNKLPAVP